ncbi:MAG: hypothetical protein JRH11_12090 [Deltaproteobacteria bacterium]|nr:hypothetical protein [Deltaproteobacteria bacterium]
MTKVNRPKKTPMVRRTGFAIALGTAACTGGDAEPTEVPTTPAMESAAAEPPATLTALPSEASVEPSPPPNEAPMVAVGEASADDSTAEPEVESADDDDDADEAPRMRRRRGVSARVRTRTPMPPMPNLNNAPMVYRGPPPMPPGPPPPHPLSGYDSERPRRAPMPAGGPVETDD